MKKNVFQLCALFFCVLISYSSTEGKLRGTSDEKHILVLHSYHQGLEWTDNVTAGIQSVFSSRADVNLVIEYLDTKRNYKREYHEALLDLYNVKNKRNPLGAIIVSDNAAFNFIAEYGDEYYPNIPVFFCGVNNLDSAVLQELPNFYGIGEKADHMGTINSIKEIFLERENVLIINDNTLTGRAINREVEEVLDSFKGQLNFEFLSAFTIESLKERVKLLDSSSAIYLLVANRDSTGKFISYTNGITEIHAVSKVPIFGSWDFYEGKGLFGGKITRGYEQGAYVAKLAERLLDHKDMKSVAKFDYVESKYVFDYLEMKTYGIRDCDLPLNSEVINKPKKRQLILKVVIVSQIALVLIILLLVFWLRYRRKKAEYLEKVIKLRTQALSESNKTLEDIIQKKDKFFSILAHDLRNQVGAFLNASILLNNPNILKKKNKVDLLHVNLLKSANQTNNLLEDLLFWGMNQFKKSPQIICSDVSLNKTIQRITKTFEVNANNIRFIYEFDAKAIIESDAQIMKFILRNIIHNAMKFSHNGEAVKITTSVNDKVVSVSVKDAGVGMSEEVIQSIYNGNPIRREGKDITTSTGLGLVTALDYLKLFNGKYSIKSQPDLGTEFILYFH